MKQYEDLVALLKRVQATGGLDCDQASICDYQDMIGHSSREQLKKLANGVYSGAFYRVYGLAYGTTEAIKFYMQNSNKVYELLLERDGLKCDLEEEKEKTEKYMDVENMTDAELIDIFNNESGIYTGEVIREICRRADMMEEYNAAGNDDFLRVVQNACFVLQDQ